ncbi:hypothetical protein ACWEOG_19355 [Amycolatopsis japonica]
MRTARPTRRQIEADFGDLGYDALVAADEVAAVVDLLADPGYEVFGLPEFDFETRSLAEFEASISPAPVITLPLANRGTSTPVVELYDFGEVA